MTIFKTVYDTTIGSSLSMTKTVSKIKESVVREGINTSYINLISSVNFLPIVINGGSFSDSEIPLFGHPLLLENFKDKNYLALDLRMLVKSDSSSGKIIIKNETEYNLAISRFILNYGMLLNGMNIMKNPLNFGSVVFSQWLSQSISKRFALDPKDQIILTIISSAYYSSLFHDNLVMNEDTKILMTKQIVASTNVDSKLVFETLDKLGPLTDIASYCENVKTVLENIRLKDFNVGLLYSIVSMSWYGLNAKEMTTMALEHIPTWLSLVYTALTERTFKNTAIANMCEKYGKRGASDEFVKNYVMVINSLKEEETRSISRATLEDLESRVF